MLGPLDLCYFDPHERFVDSVALLYCGGVFSAGSGDWARLLAVVLAVLATILHYASVSDVVDLTTFPRGSPFLCAVALLVGWSSVRRRGWRRRSDVRTMSWRSGFKRGQRISRGQPAAAREIDARKAAEELLLEQAASSI